MNEEIVDLEIKASNPEEALAAHINLFRGLVMTSYAQAEFMLVDMICRCYFVRCYMPLLPNAPPYSLMSRLKTARILLTADGPLKIHGAALLPLFDKLPEFEELRHMMAHGLMTYHHDDGDASRSFCRFLRWEIGKGGTMLFRRLQMNVESFSTRQLEVTRFTHALAAAMWKVLLESQLPPPPMQAAASEGEQP